jgi:hypothetical protein
MEFDSSELASRLVCRRSRTGSNSSTQRRRVRRNGNADDGGRFLRIAAGHEKISTIAATLVDTNVLVSAYAEAFGLSELISEDSQHGRLYGSVRVVNPFK